MLDHVSRPHCQGGDLAGREAPLAGERGEVSDPLGSGAGHRGRGPGRLRLESLNLPGTGGELEGQAPELRAAVLRGCRRLCSLESAPVELVEA